MASLRVNLIREHVRDPSHLPTYSFLIKIYNRKGLQISQELQVTFLNRKIKQLQKLLSSVLLACGTSISLQDHPIDPYYQAGPSHLFPMPS